MKLSNREQEYFVIGENVHCTRVLLRKGKRVGEDPQGRPAVLYAGPDGDERYLPIPEAPQKTREYEEGRVKHLQIAMKTAMSGEADERDTAMEYLALAVTRQVEAGVDFLDLNVDEIGFKYEEHRQAMQWLVPTVQAMTDVPLSVDSSMVETIEVGLSVLDPAKSNGRAMLNSASLERTEALDLAVKYDTKVVVTAAGESGMPQNDIERIDHATRMIELALSKGIALGDMHVDLLVFPISVDETFGHHYFDAVRHIRNKYGPEIHITGGMSNVSFGLPVRRLVNDVFVNLAVDAGADGGIIDPVSRNINDVLNMDRTTQAYQLAEDLLLGKDRRCKTFLRAYRQGELQVA